MKQFLSAIIAIGIICIIIMLAMANVTTKSHEDVHKQVNNQFGIMSNITYGLLGLDGTTTAYLNGTKDILAYNEAKRYHIWNEIIGYNVVSIEMTIIMSAFMISLSIIMAKAVK